MNIITYLSLGLCSIVVSGCVMTVPQDTGSSYQHVDPYLSYGDWEAQEEEISRLRRQRDEEMRRFHESENLRLMDERHLLGRELLKAQAQRQKARSLFNETMHWQDLELNRRQTELNRLRQDARIAQNRTPAMQGHSSWTPQHSQVEERIHQVDDEMRKQSQQRGRHAEAGVLERAAEERRLREENLLYAERLQRMEQERVHTYERHRKQQHEEQRRLQAERDERLRLSEQAALQRSRDRIQREDAERHRQQQEEQRRLQAERDERLRLSEQAALQRSQDRIQREEAERHRQQQEEQQRLETQSAEAQRAEKLRLSEEGARRRLRERIAREAAIQPHDPSGSGEQTGMPSL